MKSCFGDKDNVWHFIFDQIAHLVVICVLSYVFLNVTQQLPINFSYVIAILAFILVTKPASIFISKFYNQWNNNDDEVKADSDDAQADGGGEYIGVLERVLS